MAFHFKMQPATTNPNLARLERLEVNGFELTINDRTYNFSPLQDGARIPVTSVDNAYLNPYLGKPLTKPVSRFIRREGDTIFAELLFPYQYPAPKTTRYPEDIVIDTNGPVLLPAFSDKDEWS